VASHLAGSEVDDGKLARNPCRKVNLPRQSRREDSWSQAELHQFLGSAAKDRLAAAWLLTVYGLRRGEVCGLRWADVDLEARTITVGPTRVVINSRALDKDSPKSERGRRVLPLDDQLAAALGALRTRQKAEKMAAGGAYQAGGHVVCDELGAAVNPEWYSNEFHRIREQAGVRRIRLHDGQHKINSLMAAAGVPLHVRAAWCGHTLQVNEAEYTHTRPEDMATTGTVVSKIIYAV
jgi:integrase